MIAPDGTSSIMNGDVKCPATPAEEKHMILGILEASAAEVKEGDKFFLVTSRYFLTYLTFEYALSVYDM
jgi:hypothetical protein